MLIAILMGPALAGAAFAQAYPARPITMIVPFPAGGATDTLARYLGENMRGLLGQPIVIENVGGAAGSLGVAACGSLCSRWLYAQHRHLDHAHADRRPLRAAVRSVE